MISGMYSLPQEKHDQARKIIEKLIQGSPPQYRLPENVEFGQTRHYMKGNKKKRDPKTGKENILQYLVVDAFAVPSSPLFVSFEGHLDSGESLLLEEILANLCYLGRYESLAKFELHNGEVRHDFLPSSEGYEYLLMGKTFESLCTKTLDLQKRRIPEPIDSQWIQYQKISLPITTCKTPTSGTDRKFAYFELSHPQPLFRLTEIADAMRRAVFKNWENNEVPSVFCGKDEHGNPLRGENHVYWLPLVVGEKIRYLMAYSPHDLGENYQYLLRPYNLFWFGRKVRALPIIKGEIPIRWEGKRWESSTPFVPILDPARKDIESQVRFLLSKVRGIQPKSVTVNPQPFSEKDVRRKATQKRNGWRKYYQSKGYFITLEFDEDVAGPIVLGVDSHFGLGQFKVAV